MLRSHSKVDMTFDANPLKSALFINHKLFGEYPQRADAINSPHSEMKDIWVRYGDIKPCIESGDFSGIADEHDSVWYDAAKKLPEVMPIVFDLMKLVKGERLGGVLITKLPPGGKINPHTDAGWHAAYYDKYYAVIQNKEGASFHFEDGVIEPREGEIYWFDNSNLHWVENKTNIDRIAMIICIKTNNNLEGLLCLGQ